MCLYKPPESLTETNVLLFDRTMTLLWLLQSIINVEIGIPKSGTCWGFDEIPLPCSKDLWEAATESEWNMRYSIHKSAKKESHVLRVGDLRAAQQHNTAALSNKLRAVDLQVWSSTIDSFGALLMFAIR